MNEVYEKLQGCLKSVREKTDFKPEIALVLGSGLGEYAEEIEVAAAIDYKDIEGSLLCGVSDERCGTARTAHGTYGGEDPVSDQRFRWN